MRSLSRKSSLFLAFLLALLATLLVTNSSFASKNGTEKVGSTFTVAINFKFSGIDQICSGVLIAPKLVVTASHCVIDENGIVGTNYFFNKPGISLDTPIDPNARQIGIAKTYLHPNYALAVDKQKDDIAFIELDAPLATTGFIKIAAPADLAQLTDKQSVNGYGFGYVYESKDTYSNFVRAYPLTWRLPAEPTASTTQIESTSSTACAGDSGGPITATSKSGDEIVIAIMNRAANVQNNCGTPSPDGIYTMQATLISNYLNLVPSALLQTTTATSSTTNSPTPKPTTVKSYKITCVKGKIKKYITGTNPKCPSGYKQVSKVLIKSL